MITMKCFQNDFREINLKSNTGSDLISRRFQVNDFKGISGKSFSNQLFDLKLISKFDFNLISTKSILKLIIIILKSICFVPLQSRIPAQFFTRAGGRGEEFISVLTKIGTKRRNFGFYLPKSYKMT